MAAKFLLNAWYAAGFADTFENKPVMRTLLEQDIVFYRTQQGSLVALADRCPHRFAPLHLGKVIGDNLRCPYHGLEFGPNGRCVRNPSHHGTIPDALKTNAYPVIERSGIAWIWLGNQPADPARLLSCSDLNQEGYESVQGYVRVNAHYQLVVDNLLDLSHAEFLHPDLAAEGFNLRTQYSVNQDNDVVVANHWRPNVPISKLFAMAWGAEAPSQVDHRAIASYYPPSNVHLEVGVAGVGRASTAGPTTLALHLITPESEQASHYFWKMARNFRVGDQEFSESFRKVIQSAFESEDEPMIEAQFKKMRGASFESLKPVLLPTDAASVRARRVLSRLLNEHEQSVDQA